MEEKQLNEKESIELISQMIQSTKENMKVGSGNQFLYWGYFTVTLSVALYAISRITLNSMWQWGWFLMFAFWGFITYKTKKKSVRTYTDVVVEKIWLIMGIMLTVAAIASIISIKLFAYPSMILMMPLSCLHVSLGVSITGIIIKERWVIFLPVFSFLISFYMLSALIAQQTPMLWWDLLMGLSFVFGMIIPGHILNHKANKKC